MRRLRQIWFKKGSGTVVQSTLQAVPATVPDPFLNHVEFRHIVRRWDGAIYNTKHVGLFHSNLQLTSRDSLLRQFAN